MVDSTHFPVGAGITLDELEHDPHTAIERLRTTEPMSWLPALNGWFVTNRSLVSSALRDDDVFTVDDPRFSTGQVVGPSMLSTDGAEHRRHRTPFVPPFRPRIVAADLGQWVAEMATELVDHVRPSGRAELRTAVAAPLAVATISRALGLAQVGNDDVLRWYLAIVEGVNEITAGRDMPAATRDAVLELREQVLTSDRVHRIGASGSLTDDELFSNVAVVMFGAIETSEGMTANALFHILSDHETFSALAADRSFIDLAIEESLRLEPAAAVVDRYATRNVRLGDVDIAERDLVVLSLAGANRDPAHFRDPHHFVLRRENAATHLSFVQGPHACIGLHLAKLETRAAIGAVLNLLPAIRLDPAASTGPHGLIFRKPPAVVGSW
jgi:cytochrome P450